MMFAIIPLLFVGAGIWLIASHYSFKKRAISVQAEVISVERNLGMSTGGRGRRANSLYTPTYRYVDANGDVQEAKSRSSSSRYNYPIGTTREILIDPNDPGFARSPNAPIAMGALFIVGGALASLILLQY